ncbi:hypothetical protein [Bacteroides sp.]|uniref:hypothetical protein n=1 Tax=Bacteroides sp. TaxID=29523 RepID=UPI0023D19430|nr:hypothetical protein [Bacteroides sp.]MDE5711469.1 hypothetical protein [Bacteroides sp.]MDE6216164.1 hypothetical protein [Bacteroides sp.]
MSIFSEANMIACIESNLPEGQHFKAGIHAVVKKVKLRRFFSGVAYDPSSNLIQPLSDAPLLYVTKSKEADFDAYMGFSEDYLVIVPCEKERWYYEHVEITDPELVADILPVAMNVESPFSASDILPVYPLSQVEKCSMKKNWIGAYVCEITFDNGDYLKVLLPPLAGLFGGMPHHKVYREAIVKLLEKKG